MKGAELLADAHVHAFQTPSEGRDWVLGVGIETDRSGALDEYQHASIANNIGPVTLLLHARAQLLLENIEIPEVDNPVILDRIRSYNTWGLEAAKARKNTVAAAGIDPRLMSETAVRDEIARTAGLGATALKYVPASSRTYADDPRVWPIFEEAVKRGLVIVAQSGHSGPKGERGEPYGRPKYFRGALEALPDLNIVFAHFAEGFEQEVVDLGTQFSGVRADLSGRLRESMDDTKLVDQIRRLGEDKVLFGSNYPIGSLTVAVKAFARLVELGIDASAVGSDNWMSLFGTPTSR